MKKNLFVFFVILTISFIACNDSHDLSFTNKSQNIFENILSKYNKSKHSYNNEIQKIDSLKSFDREILKFIDSTKYFVNWKASIKDIKVSDRSLNSQNYKVLTFTLYYEPDEHREVEFECLKSIEIDSLETDLLYNNIKNIANYSTVYFDGIIRKDDNGQIDYSRYSGEKDDMRLSYPSFNFNIFNITQKKRSDTLSNSLKSLIDIDIQIIEHLKMNQEKKYDINKYTEQYIPVVDSLRKEITPEEIYWRNKFVNHYLHELANLKN